MITVTNKRQPPVSGIANIYIGRPSPLGNPFVIGRDGDRDEVVDKYRRWLWLQLIDHAPANPVTHEMNRLADLFEAGDDMNLVCWCAPKRCHGDVLADAITWWAQARNPKEVQS